MPRALALIALLAAFTALVVTGHPWFALLILVVGLVATEGLVR